MVLIIYFVQCLLSLAVGAIVYILIKPSIPEARRAAIAGIAAILFMLGTTAFVAALGLIPDYEHVLTNGE